MLHASNVHSLLLRDSATVFVNLEISSCSLQIHFSSIPSGREEISLVCSYRLSHLLLRVQSRFWLKEVIFGLKGVNFMFIFPGDTTVSSSTLGTLINVVLTRLSCGGPIFDVALFDNLHDLSVIEFEWSLYVALCLCDVHFSLLQLTIRVVMIHLINII